MSQRIGGPLQRLTGCVKDSLRQAEITVCGVFLTTGQNVTIDAPPGESMSWVRLVDITVAQTETPSGTTCTTPWTVSVEVGITHCWPLQEDPLTVDQHLAAQVKVDDSMMALYKGIACCPDWLPTGKKGMTVVRWAPIGPQGGIVGGAWLLTFEV